MRWEVGSGEEVRMSAVMERGRGSVGAAEVVRLKRTESNSSNTSANLSARPSATGLTAMGEPGPAGVTGVTVIPGRPPIPISDGIRPVSFERTLGDRSMGERSRASLADRPTRRQTRRLQRAATLNCQVPEPPPPVPHFRRQGSEVMAERPSEEEEESPSCSLCSVRQDPGARFYRRLCPCTAVWCQNCLKDRIQKTFQSNDLNSGVKKIGVFCGGCDARLPLGAVKECLEGEELNSFLRQALDAQLTQHSLSSIKVCPECGWVSVTESEVVKCGSRECGAEFCSLCGVVHRPGTDPFPNCPLRRLTRSLSRDGADKWVAGSGAGVESLGGISEAASLSEAARLDVGNENHKKGSSTIVNLLPKSPTPKGKKDQRCPSCKSEGKFAENVVGLSLQCLECGYCFCRTCLRKLNSFHTLRCLLVNQAQLLPPATCLKTLRASTFPSIRCFLVYLALLISAVIWVPLVGICTPAAWFCSEFHYCIYRMDNHTNCVVRFLYWLLSILSFGLAFISIPLYSILVLVLGLIWPVLGERGWRCLLTMLDLAVVSGNPYLNFSLIRRVVW